MREELEELGQVIDRLDSLVGALQLPLSDRMHVDQLRSSLPKVVTDLKAGFVKVAGENPWE